MLLCQNSSTNLVAHQVSVNSSCAVSYHEQLAVAPLLKNFNKNSREIWLCISNSHTCGQRKQQTVHSINRILWPWPNGYYLLLPVFLAHFCLNLPTNFRSINIATFKACFRLVLLGRPRMSASKQLIIGAINQYLCFL